MESLIKNKITVLGSGESGMGAAMLAAKHGLDVLLSDSGALDSEKKNKLTDKHISYEEHGHNQARIFESDLAVKSPGIPGSAKIVQELNNANIPVISEIEFAYRYCKSKIVGITGSNGKTTTALLTHHLLKSGGANVGLAGNIGNSLSALLMEHEYDLVVVELSSFQLDDVDTFVADTAVLLNITPDHLDRYEYSIDKYADAKMNIFNNQGPAHLMIYNADDSLVTQKIKQRNIEAQSISFTIENTDSEVVLTADKMLKFHEGERALELPLSSLNLIGKHNIYNTMAAVSVALHYGISGDDIIQGLKTFKNAPHRLEYVDELEGIQFINDSKATNVDSVYYALEGIDKPIVWIAGGINKGNDYDQITELVSSKVKSLVCLGIDNNHLLDTFSENVNYAVETETMANAIAQAYGLADAGDVVLLSPACSSFDLFENYEARGNAFKMEVLELKKKLKTNKALVL